MLPNTVDNFYVLRQTSFEWVGACWSVHGLAGFVFGRATPQAAVVDLDRTDAGPLRTPGDREFAELERLIEVLSKGLDDDLLDIRLDLSNYTDFQSQVVLACRQIPRGQTRTYGELAKQAGSPRAARAVGSVMAKNRFPLIVPCHRVVAVSSIGGFSAPSGVHLKRRMLAAEGVQLP